MTRPSCLLALGLSLVLLVGCASNANRLEQAKRSVDESVQVYVTGTVDALHMALPSPAVDVASKLSGYAQDVAGLPPPGARLDARALIANEASARKPLESRRVADEKAIEEKRAAEAKLIEMGKVEEAAQHKSVVRRIIFWATSTFGIGGAIALCIFFPPLIPVLLQVFGTVAGWIIKLLPSVGKAAGVVAAAAYHETAAGAQKLHDVFATLNTHAPDTTFTAAQVQEMIAQHVPSVVPAPIIVPITPPPTS